jgi:glycosyltransferase involved in cell wall biosynthesis
MPEPATRITYLTAGAAGMFCGSCMHDNTLVRALIAQGHDVMLVPTYTPIRTDEHDVSVDQVFFGGINVYLQQKLPLFRYVPRVFDRILDRPSLIRRVASRATNLSPAALGSLTLSMLKGSHGYQRKEVRRLCDWLKSTAHPELVVLTNMLIGGCIPEIKRQLKVPVLVVLQGDDVFLESLPENFRAAAFREIKRIAESVDGFLAHSHYYADFMANYLSIDRQQIEITPLGIDTDELQSVTPRQHEPRTPMTIGYFARLAPEKGLHLLVDAFIELRQRERLTSAPARKSKLKVAGWMGENNAEFAEREFEKLRQAGLADDFEYLGAVDRQGKLDFFRSIDLLCVPTVYHEPKGLFALEAMAAGIPVLLPEHGAFPEMIRDSQGGRLVPPDSPANLVYHIENLLDDHALRQQLGAAGRSYVLERRNAALMAQETWRIFQKHLR